MSNQYFYVTCEVTNINKDNITVLPNIDNGERKTFLLSKILQCYLILMSRRLTSSKLKDHVH